MCIGFKKLAGRLELSCGLVCNQLASDGLFNLSWSCSDRLFLFLNADLEINFKKLNKFSIFDGFYEIKNHYFSLKDKKS